MYNTHPGVNSNLHIHRIKNKLLGEKSMVTLGFEPSLPATHGTWLYIEYRQPRLFPFHPPSEASQRGRVT